MPERETTYLLIEPGLVERADGVRVAVNPPRRETVFAEHCAWDRTNGLYLTLLDEGDRLRLWYGCRANADPRAKLLALIESEDGVTWRRPALGVVDFQGSRENNLVNLPTMEGAVYLDPHEAPERRYGFVGSCFGQGLFRWTSPDGACWTRDPQPLLDYESDTQNVAFWDSQCGKYVLYVRMWREGSNTTRRRKVGRLEADSLAAPLAVPHAAGNEPVPGRERRPHFTSEARVVLECDECDPPDTDIYTMVPVRYPAAPRYMLAFPTFYRHFPEADDGPYKNDGLCEPQCAISLDGVTWSRPDRAAYAPLGLTGGPEGGMLYMGQGMTVRGEEVWQYGVAFRTPHGTSGLEQRVKSGDGRILRFVQRLDGFAAMWFEDAVGTLTTRPVRCAGDRLLLNVDAGGLGSLQVALLDEAGAPLPGFSFTEADPLCGNAVRLAATWRGSADLSALHGRTVRLAVRARRCRLFAFRFVEDAPHQNDRQERG